MSGNITAIVEAAAAAAAPVTTGVWAYFRWRTNSITDRRRREESVIIAANKAASDARTEERQAVKDLTLSKDNMIERLETLLANEQRDNDRLQAENNRLQEELRDVYRGKRNNSS